MGARRKLPGLCRFEFKAMGSPCQLRLYADDPAQAAAATHAAVTEIERLEQRYSRYRPGNLLDRVNQAAQAGGRIAVDEEFTALLEYADHCHRHSDGLFDVTAGVLREAWTFDGQSALPDEALLEQLRARIGWRHVSWRKDELAFARPGMELDFGGLVKEYAADRAATICLEHELRHGVVDLGGDMRLLGPQPGGEPWPIGIRHPRQPGRNMADFSLRAGALASSGDYERCVIIDGERYSHLLSPITGWPVRGLAAVSVAAPQCVLAGSACTIAMLKGSDGPDWLRELGLPHVWMDGEGRRGGSV